jgi:hypothetical protein
MLCVVIGTADICCFSKAVLLWGVGCKIIWQVCSDGLALGWIVKTGEPFEITALNFV